MFPTDNLYRRAKRSTRYLAYCAFWVFAGWAMLSSGNSSLFSQAYWQPLEGGVGRWPFGLYGDSISDALYILGRMEYPIENPLQYDKIYQWRGDALAAFASSSTDGGAIPRAVSYKGDLYVCGTFFELDTVYSPGFARWTGNSWERPAVELPNTAVYWMITHGDDLYLSGTFDSVGTMRASGVVKWDGEQWTPVGNMHSLHSGPARVYTMAFYKDILYAGGNMQDSTGKEADLLWFKDSVWQEPPGWQNGSFTTVTSLVVFQDELYVGGAFSKARGNAANGIRRWDGHTWRDVGSGTFGGAAAINSHIEQMYVHKDALYVVGYFHEVDGIPAQYIARWDGRQWCSLSSSSFSGHITDLSSWRDTLYVAGGFITIDGDTMNYVAKWMEDWSSSVCGPLHAPTALEDIQAPEAVGVFPNPGSTQVFLELPLAQGPVSIRIFTASGVCIRSEEIYPGHIFEGRIQWDVSGFTAGIYFVEITSGNRRYYKKFLKI